MRENLDAWVKHHFSLSVPQLLEEMRRKPLREFVATFSRDNDCAYACTHCFMVESDERQDRPDADALDALLASPRSDGAATRETYAYYQDPGSHLEEFMATLARHNQSFVELDPVIFLEPGAESLAERLRSCGVDTIAYSIHGDAAAHRELTLQPTKRWEKLVDGFRAAGSLGFTVEVSSCFWTGNAERVDALAETIESIGCVDTWLLNRVVPTGRARSWSPDKFLYGNRAGPVARRLGHAIGQMTTIRKAEFDVTWGPNFYGDHGQALLGKRRHVERGTYNCHIVSDVALGINNTWTSRFTGDVFPCIYAIGKDELRIGRLSNGKIEVDESKAEVFDEDRRRNQLSGICSPDSCGFTEVCMGCRSIAFGMQQLVEPHAPISPNQGLDFCISHYIQEHRDDPQLLDDLAPVISHAPVEGLGKSPMLTSPEPPPRPRLPIVQ